MALRRPDCISEAVRLDTGPGTSEQKRRRIAAEIQASAHTPTPLGPVVKELTAGLTAVPYVCPFASLWLLCEKSHGYAAFLAECLGHGQLARIVLYCDEVRPGNPLRPENARTYCAVFWQFLDYPDWYRSSALGWHDLCIIKESVVQSTPGGISAVMATILRTLWSSTEHNFERLGLRVACPRLPGGELHVKATFACFLLDERAEKYIFNLKGSSGTKLCMSCSNVVGRCDPAHVPAALRHFTIPGLDGCEEHTRETFAACVDFLRAQHGNAGFQDMQQALGLSYDPQGLLFSDMRELVKVPDSRFIDWMHSICASGGICQVMLQDVCEALIASGLPLQQLDTFQRGVKGTRLSPAFFEHRVRPGRAFIKAFASEAIEATKVLHLFCVHVLQEDFPALSRRRSMVFAMSEVLDILQTGDAAIAKVPRLQALLLRFHRDAAVVMPDRITPKFHYVHHIPDHLAKNGVNLSCFSPERKHAKNKKQLHYVYRNMEVTLASNNLHDMLHAAAQPYAFERCAVRTETASLLRRFAAEMRHAAVAGPVQAFLDGRAATGWVHRHGLR